MHKIIKCLCKIPNLESLLFGPTHTPALCLCLCVGVHGFMLRIKRATISPQQKEPQQRYSALMHLTHRSRTNTATQSR